MPNIKTKLDEIEKAFDKKFLAEDVVPSEVKSFYRQAFLELLEGELNSIVPEVIPLGQMGFARMRGFNDCRSELLSRIKARLEH